MNRDIARCADLCFRLDCNRNLIHVETGKIYNFSSFAERCPEYGPLVDFDEFTTSELLRLIEPRLNEPVGNFQVNIDHFIMFELVNRLDPKSKTFPDLERRDCDTYEKLMVYLRLRLDNLPWVVCQNLTPSVEYPDSPFIQREKV